jgi:hypothetical protein
MPIESFYSKADHSNTVIEAMIRGRDDKRDFIRMSIESEVSFTRPGSSETYSGKTMDLSATGLRFITKTHVQVGEMLEITIKPGVAITPPLEVTMAVVRVVETEDGQYDVAGVTKTNSGE